MQKLTTTLIGLFLVNLLPLAFDPTLMLHWKNIIMLLGNAALWMAHPRLLTDENNQATDKKTIHLILFSGLLCMILTVVQWAYFTADKNGTALLNGLGITLILGGVSLRNYSIALLDKQFTSHVKIVADHELITKGPYRLLRHPSYTGAYVAMLGTGVLLQTWAMLVVTAIAVFYAYYKRVEAEEATLLQHFGAKYQLYQQQTKRMFPMIW
jgi:protein-S-isoprenylcysteine O-methyltransferase